MDAVALTDGVVDVAIVCSDFDGAVEFYTVLLGLPVAEDIQIPPSLAVPSGLAPSGFRHLRLRAGKTLLKLMEISPAPGPATHEFRAGIRWLTLRVEDLAATVGRLEAQGVKFMSPPIRGLAGYFACAEAPDGVILEFVERFSDE
jgi:catechol 2,3-dioxygenase-like lactoylglutathione lyase family enzyme